MSGTGQRCVLVFSRSPEREGAVKGIAEARGLFELSLARLARAVEGLPGVALVNVGTGQQRGHRFGERLQNAFRDVFALGFTRVVAVGSDVPSLGAEELAAAFEALERGETPLGPSPDGGVYLIGAASDPADLLARVRWLGSHVLQDLLEAVGSRGGRATLLGPLADVDGYGDLVRLAGDAGLDAELRALIRLLLAHRAPRPLGATGRGFAPCVRIGPARGPPLSDRRPIAA